MYSLIVTAKMNDIDPRAWLADVLARLPQHNGFTGAGSSVVELAGIGASTRRMTPAYAGCLRLIVEIFKTAAVEGVRQWVMKRVT